MGVVRTGRIGVEVSEGEHEECDVEGEEEDEEGDGGPQGADQQEGGEDKPAGEVESHGVVEIIHPRAICRVTADDLESPGCQDDCEREPESSEGRERRGTEGIPNRHLPVCIF